MNDLRERLENSYERVIYPVALGDVPIELEKMAIRDEDDTITGYHSINSLAKEPGKLFVPKPFNHEGTLMHIRRGFDKRVNSEGLTDEQATRDLLTSKGLVDMLDGKEAKDIVVGDLTGNEFGIFGTYEFKEIPAEIVVVETDV